VYVDHGPLKHFVFGSFLRHVSIGYVLLSLGLWDEFQADFIRWMLSKTSIVGLSPTQDWFRILVRIKQSESILPVARRDFIIICCIMIVMKHFRVLIRCEVLLNEKRMRPLKQNRIHMWLSISKVT
jgi:hypothetical protein